MIKTSLQTRLTILTALASIFLISAFTTIQIHNQLGRAGEFSVFKAKEGAFVVREELQRIFAGAGPDAPQAPILDEIKKIFIQLEQTGMFETAVLMDPKGDPVILEGNLKLYVEDTDREFLKKLSQTKKESRWLFPLMDKENKVGNLFLLVKNPHNYITKLSFSLSNMEAVLREVYGPVALTVVIVILGNAVLAALLSGAIISPIKLFNKATKDVAGGNLDLKVSVDTKDELEELAGTFNYMTVELKKMKERAENANPLTKLPGNIVIRERVEERLSQSKKILLIYSDLDNFKAFNDKYGVEAGDRAILLTADIMREAVSKSGVADEDFVGHEGGDDFLLLTTPERADAIAKYIIESFDKRIRDIYSAEDLGRGFIESIARDGTRKNFPIMTISLAGVGNHKRVISSYAELTNIAAEVKHKLKEMDGSNFLIDRRTGEKDTEQTA